MLFRSKTLQEEDSDRNRIMKLQRDLADVNEELVKQALPPRYIKIDYLDGKPVATEGQTESGQMHGEGEWPSDQPPRNESFRNLLIAFNSKHPRLAKIEEKDLKTKFRDQDSQSGPTPVTHLNAQEEHRAEALEFPNPTGEKVFRRGSKICFWGQGCKDRNCTKVHPAAPSPEIVIGGTE